MGPSEVTPGPDPAGATDPALLEPRRPRRRARRRAVVPILLLLLAGGGVGIGVQQRQVADGWRDRSVLLEQQRDEAIGRAEALGAQLDELGAFVELSREDRLMLEERLAELAGEKAQAEDRATVTREQLATLATTVSSAVTQLNACTEDLIALQRDTIDAFNRSISGERVDVTPLNQRLDETRARCNAARQAGASAVALANRLR
jgi:chromosome segregation ATPase